MSWRKNVFSYLMWAVYTIMAGTAMIGIGNIFCDDMRLPAYCGAVSAVLLTAAAGGFALLLHRFAPRLKACFQKRKKMRVAAEAALVTVLFALGIMFRVQGLRGVEETSPYYELAEVAMGQDMSRIAHGAVYIYVRALHFIFLFLGNHFVFGIMAQMVFQGIAALLLYFQVRKYVGHIAALVVAGFFTCAPFMVRGGLTLSPDVMYLCLFAVAGAVVAAGCGHGYGYKNGTAGRKPAPPFFILAGIVSSVMAYLDVAGMLLLLFSVGMIFCVDRELSGLGRKAVSCLCCVLGFVFGFAGCALADSLAGGKSFGSVLQVWLQLYLPEDFRLSATVGMPDSRVEILLLLGLMALGIYSFWFEKKRERLTVYMSATCAVIFADCFGIFTAEMPGTLFLYLLFVIMAGISLEQCFSGGEALRTQTAQAEAAEPEADASFGSAVENQKNQEDPKNSEKQINQEGQKVQEQSKNEPDALADKEPEEKTEKNEIRYLENPLPLPKKHEKKVLDYDHPVADDDDFDI